MKNEIINLGKDSIIYGAGGVLTRFIGLFTLPLFTARLSTEDYGALAMIGLLTTIAHPIFSLGLSAAIGPSYFDKNDIKNKSSVIWTGFSINLISALILTSIGLILPSSLGELINLPKQYHEIISLSLISYSFTILTTCLLIRIQFEKRKFLYVFITLVTALTSILVSLYYVLILNMGAKGMVIGQFSANFICFFICFLISIREINFRINLKVGKKILKLGMSFIASNIFLFLLLQSNKFFLEAQYGLKAVGVYSIGFNLGATISLITTGVSTAWYPFYMSYMNKKKDCEIIFGKIFTYCFTILGYICILYFLFAKPILIILTNPDYYDASKTIGWVSIAFFSQLIYSLLLPGMYFTDEVGFQAIIQAIASIIGLGINYIFIYFIGIEGAAIGLAISNILMAFLTYLWNIYRKDDYPIIKYEWRRIFKFVFLSLLVIYLYGEVNSLSLTMEILRSTFYAILGLIATISIINKRELSQIKSLLN